MIIDYLPSGTSACPLIRLYSYRPGEVNLLRAVCDDLAEGRKSQFALHEQPWVYAIDRCRFIWRANPKDIGVRTPKAGEPFVLDYSDEAWREVADKLLPFAENSGGFNWLTNDEGDVGVLISLDGTW